MADYELTAASQLAPGNVVKLAPEEEPITLTVIRLCVDGNNVPKSVSLYREPTDEEYNEHFQKHGSDLRATWVTTCVPNFHILRSCVPQAGDLAH